MYLSAHYRAFRSWAKDQPVWAVVPPIMRMLPRQPVESQFCPNHGQIPWMCFQNGGSLRRSGYGCSGFPKC